MNNELRTLATAYIRQIAGALALRAKGAPVASGYDTLVDAMARLSLAVRSGNVSDRELLQAVYMADLSWQEWFDGFTRFEPRLLEAYNAALESGDWVTVLSQYEVTGGIE